MHLCFLSKEFLGLGYDFYSPLIDNYGVMTFELFQCRKCKKLFYVSQVFMSDVLRERFNDRLNDIEKVGYKPIGELIKVNCNIDK
jgi:hypothetical protein